MLTRLTTLIGLVLLSSVSVAIAQNTDGFGLGDTLQIAVFAVGGISLLLLNRSRSVN